MAERRRLLTTADQTIPSRKDKPPPSARSEESAFAPRSSAIAWNPHREPVSLGSSPSFCLPSQAFADLAKIRSAQTYPTRYLVHQSGTRSQITNIIRKMSKECEPAALLNPDDDGRGNDEIHTAIAWRTPGAAAGSTRGARSHDKPSHNTRQSKRREL